jgi:hypothetical protein
MISQDIDPRLIGERSHIDYEQREMFNRVRFGKSLIEFIQKNGWDKIPRIPVFTLPSGLAHEYVLADGHYRHETALRLGFILPCNIYDRNDQLGRDNDGLASCWMFYDSIKECYDYIIELYIKHHGIKGRSNGRGNRK